MNSDTFETRKITKEDIDLAIARAHKLRGEMIVDAVRQLGALLVGSVASILASRPSADNHALPLNR